MGGKHKDSMKMNGDQSLVRNSSLSSELEDGLSDDFDGVLGSQRMASTRPMGARKKMLMEEILANTSILAHSDPIPVMGRSVACQEEGGNQGLDFGEVSFPPLSATKSSNWAQEMDCHGEIRVDEIVDQPNSGVNGKQTKEAEEHQEVADKDKEVKNSKTSDLKKKWRNLFSDNRSSGKGLKLNFEPPVSSDFLVINDGEWEED